MSKDETLERSIALLRSIVKQSGEVQADTPLLATGLLDSIAVLQTTLALERSFGLVLRPMDIEFDHFETPRTLAARLDELKQRAA